ncbi:MAG: AEC family transporter [Rickettsiaceae bacterium]|nr:AEC family transporter [Rickettsiaceae bacterium]
MSIFWLIFLKIISILLSVIVGFVAGKLKKIETENIAALLFYFIAPIVFFSVPASTRLSLSDFSIITTSFTISSLLAVLTFFCYSGRFCDQERNLLATSSGTGNTGFFMFPIAGYIFDDYTLSIYIMSAVGVNIYEASLGYYISLRSVETAKEAFKKIIRMPMLIAFVLGSCWSVAGLALPSFLNQFLNDMRSTYSILGMTMIGLSLAKISKFEIDIKFTLASLFSKYIIYPLAVIIFVIFDNYVLRWYSQSVYKALILLSSSPVASNMVVISSLMKMKPEKSATTILISCAISLFYIPAIVSFVIGMN